MSLIAPVAIILVAENLGHIKAIGAMTGRNLDPYLGRAFMGDGLATMLSGSSGGTGMTTYAENMGVMAVTRIYSTLVFLVAAGIALLLGLSPKFGAFIGTIPGPVLGGLSIVVFGLIAATAGRIWVENRVDFSNPRNLITVAVALVLGAGNFKLNVGGFTLDGIGTATFGAIILYHLLEHGEPSAEATSDAPTLPRRRRRIGRRNTAIGGPRWCTERGLFRRTVEPCRRPAFSQQADAAHEFQISQQTLPPQTQDRQPGHETEMNPQPDYAPRYPGQRAHEGQGGAHHRRRQRHRPRRRGSFRARRGRCRHRLPRRERGCAGDQATRRAGRAHMSYHRGRHRRRSLRAQAVEQVIDKLRQARHARQQRGRAASARRILPRSAPEQLERTFRTNIFGYFYMTQAALPHLKEGAAIINTTSVTAYRGSPELAGLQRDQGRHRRVHPLAREEARREGNPRQRRRARADLDAAHPVDFPAEKVAKFGADTPMKRPGQPNEVAPCFLFLACEDSSYITGAVLHPNGGDPTES